ncbi:elongation factor G [Sediminispirochaeta smaragdinae]|uniref:Elongation factor G n=1 Tax=Sediminispirochaeta smaragdinae (strain DSM 11293 / JCM 15392 / SEBR 4228) TaxID=573413 RepID=E1R4A8_SEDSS|nr:elongation factor G [Sediminispirochaeta smaragdinae]ADK81649.1 small GTP-binding protein [Sediminispirochaeta smaragdinae DSM 11293]
MSFTSADIRNLAIIGHNGTGKTTLLEQILYNGGIIPKAEGVDSGKSVSDFTDEEQERGMSIHTSLASLEWKGHQINLLDTPGTADFIGEVVCAFRATESAVMVVSGRSGVQIETIKLWRRLNGRNMPRIVFINELDKEHSSFQKSFGDLKEKFEKTFVPVTIPIGDGTDFKGIVNLIENKAYLIHEAAEKDEPIDIPADMNAMVEEYRLQMIESAAEGDDDLMEKYFAEGTLTEDEIRKGLREGLRDNKIVPVLCGSAVHNNGIASLLNFITNNAPSPEHVNEKADDADGKEVEVEISKEKPMSCMVFKTTIDQFSGKLSYVKVVTGELNSNSELYNPREKRREKGSKIYRAIGKKLIEVSELTAGDIGIITKLDGVRTNDTLCSSNEILTYHKLALPQPVFGLTVNAASKKAEDKLNEFLHRASEEDPTFDVSFNKETKESVISGMGELHITIILDKIRNKQKIEVETKTPKVAYRETITKSANAEYTHKKQTGGHGQYGKVAMEINPLARGEKFTFQNAIKGGSISKGYMPGIEKGIIEGMEEGYLAHYPIVDLGAVIIDGKEHPVDSSEMAFKMAAKGALRACLEKAGVMLLEPIMKLRVFADEQYLGDILSDLSGKRGRVLGQENLGGGIVEIDAEVPQAEMLRYAIDLRSITSGTGSFELDFDHYATLTGKNAEQVIAESKAMVTEEE